MRVRRRTMFRGLAAGAVVAAIVGTFYVLAARDAEKDSTTRGAETEHVTLEVVARIPAGRAPQAVAVTDDAVWVTAAGSLRLLRFDPNTEERTARVGFQAVPAAVVVAGGRVWIGFAEGDEIARLPEDDPESGGESVRVGQTPQALAVAEDGSGVWVAALNEPVVAFVDADTASVSNEIDFEEGFPAAVATGFGRVWVPDVVANILLELDPAAGGEPRPIRVGSSPTVVATGEGAVWVGNFDSRTMSRFDPASGRVTGGVRLGGPVGGITVGAGYVWVTEQERGRVIAVDPDTGEIAGEVEVGSVPQGIAVGSDGSVWVAVQGDNAVVRIGVR